jgi:hypothetical protein
MLIEKGPEEGGAGIGAARHAYIANTFSVAAGIADLK